MKELFALALIAGALMFNPNAQARMLATKSQCVASCSGAVSDSCGWITKRGKFNRCRSKLIRQCRKWGTDVMCPIPPPPTTPTTLPTVTPTTLPIVTTTTRPPLPPTTTTSTTLPLVSSYTGSYEFSGQRTTNTCTSTFGLPEFFFVTWDVESYFGQNLFGTAYDHPTSYFFANTMQGIATYPHWTMTSAQCELQSIGPVWCGSLTLAADGLPDFGETVPGAMVVNFTFFDGRPNCTQGWTGFVED